MKKIWEEMEEAAFELSVLACCFPFLFVILSFFETGEPYNLLIFSAFLMVGSFLGSVLGIILLFCNRRKKSKKIYILSMIPVFLFFVSMILPVGYYP